ncbi:MAG: LacI family transcriptional regulator [Alphaproteobacteria bacterium]|nr:LacI family transcriptional regulator [Alphaproteobacteria bacterium]
MNGQPTLKDVARACGVTAMTVSNVLNGRDKEVGPETRKRILKAIDDLGYRPNFAAKRLRAQKTSAIGMLVLDDVPEFLNDPFTTQVVAGLSNFATEHGYSLILQGLRSESPSTVPMLGHLQTDGVCAILSGSPDTRRKFIKRALGLRVPLILIQEEFDHPLVCSLRQDDRGAARAIAEYLVDRGARRFCYLAPSAHWPAISERIAGSQDVCNKAGCSLTVIECGDESFEATQKAVASSIGTEGLPDAYIGGNDRMAMATIRLLQDRQLAVPEDVRVTGFNAFDFASFAAPSLVTARSDAYEMGRRAGIEMLKGIELGGFEHNDFVLPVSFVAGQSA